MKQSKIILADVDGVMLKWIHSFEYWMQRKGYRKVAEGEYELGATYGITEQKADALAIEFNGSAAMGYLPPIRDSLEYVRKLHEEHGFVFHCITAIPYDPYVKMLRQENLNRVFGPTVVERLECSETAENKYVYLSEYANTGLPWIEDRWQNAIMGRDLGLNSILIDHDYNRQYSDVGITRVKNWKEIYELMTKQV
jgi:hypothetical protein